MKIEAKFKDYGVTVSLPIECEGYSYYSPEYDVVMRRLATALRMDYSHSEIVDEDDE